MRKEPNTKIERFRVQHPPYVSDWGVNWGAFQIDHLRIISSGSDSSTGWEHVSVSCKNRCPTWDEMCQVKELFWRDDEAVVQFHPPKSEYVNDHPYTLHLWKKIGAEVELPPSVLVGFGRKT